jgi:4'-phosphopantetheinyl transferase
MLSCLKLLTMEIGNGEVHLWFIEIDPETYTAEKQMPCLSVIEAERVDAFVFEADKIKYVLVHHAVRTILAKYTGQFAADIKFDYAFGGKPFLLNSDLSFNYSYRNNTALLGVSNQQEIGVDIEEVRDITDIPTLAEFSFSRNEREFIFKGKKEGLRDRLFTLWTFKEAVIKALGKGLNADLTKIDLSQFMDQEFLPLPYDDGNHFTLKSIEAPEGYKAAMALRGQIQKLQLFIFNNI